MHPPSAEQHEINSETGRSSTVTGGLPSVLRLTPGQSHRLGISAEYQVSLFNPFLLRKLTVSPPRPGSLSFTPLAFPQSVSAPQI